MSKRKAGGSHRAHTRQFNELSKNELLIVAQLKNKELSKFPYLRPQNKRVEDNVNFTEYIEISCYYRSLLMVVLVIFPKKTA